MHAFSFVTVDVQKGGVTAQCLSAHNRSVFVAFTDGTIQHIDMDYTKKVKHDNACTHNDSNISYALLSMFTRHHISTVTVSLQQCINQGQISVDPDTEGAVVHMSLIKPFDVRAPLFVYPSLPKSTNSLLPSQPCVAYATVRGVVRAR